jgi:hypothetical protein
VNTTATEKVLDRKTREADERIRRAIDRGGLPTEAEFDAIDAALSKAYNLIEAVASRVAGVAEIEHVSDPPPYTVTLEQIGRVAVLASDLLDLDIPQLQREAERMRDTIGPLDTIRRGQS